MSQSVNKTKSWRQRGTCLTKYLLIMIPILLLGWTFHQVPFDQIWTTLQQLEPTEIGVWLLVNIGLLTLMTGRWWILLRTIGPRLPYLKLIRYRLGSFAVSYFTPGPQFGGEPLQVLALRQRHGIPGTTSTASVGLDKLLELIANFSFLVFGIAIAFMGTWLPKELRGAGILFALSWLAIPLLYLILMLAGYEPIKGFMDRLPIKITQNWFGDMLVEVETEMSDFCVAYPWTVLLATLISLSVWVGMVFEYGLLTYFLGLRLSVIQTIGALTAARLAFLTPLPGGVGALEASQVLAMQSLGLDPSYGVSISLMIRLRDILFGLAGLLGAVSLLGWRFPRKVRNPKDV